jgi:hypothetical protein
MRRALPVEPELTATNFSPAACRRSARLGAVRMRSPSLSSMLASSLFERALGIDRGDVDEVAHEPVAVRIAPGRERRGVDPRDRREHGMAVGEVDALAP